MLERKRSDKLWPFGHISYSAIIIYVIKLSSLGSRSSPEHDELLNMFENVFLTYTFLKILPTAISAAWRSPALARRPLALNAWPGQGHGCQLGAWQAIYTSGRWPLTPALRSHGSVEEQSIFKENTLPWLKREPGNCEIKGLQSHRKSPGALFDR